MHLMTRGPRGLKENRPVGEEAQAFLGCCSPGHCFLNSLSLKCRAIIFPVSDFWGVFLSFFLFFTVFAKIQRQIRRVFMDFELLSDLEFCCFL